MKNRIVLALPPWITSQEAYDLIEETVVYLWGHRYSPVVVRVIAPATTLAAKLTATQRLSLRVSDFTSGHCWFIDEMHDYSKLPKCSLRDLYEAFSDWHRVNHCNVVAPSRRMFTHALQIAHPMVIRGGAGRSRAIGIGMRSRDTLQSLDTIATAEPVT